MFNFFAIPAHDARLITPRAALSGPNAWVNSDMIFLTVLAARGGVAMTRAMRDVSENCRAGRTGARLS